MEDDQPKLIRGNGLKMLAGFGIGIALAVIAKLVLGREGMGPFVIIGSVVLVLVLAFWAYSWWYVTKTERGRAAWAAHAERKRGRA